MGPFWVLYSEVGKESVFTALDTLCVDLEREHLHPSPSPTSQPESTELRNSQNKGVTLCSIEKPSPTEGCLIISPERFKALKFPFRGSFCAICP